MMMHSTESLSTSSSLLRRVKAQDAVAWRRLVDLYGPLVFYWCQRYGLREQDAADVFQNVFLSVAEAIEGFREDEPASRFRAWLWTITRNKLHDFYRRQDRLASAAGGTDAQIELAAIPEQLPADADDAQQNAHTQAIVRRAIELVKTEFEPDTWRAFWRFAVDGQPAASVGEELGMTANTVRQAKFRVLRRLREELGNLVDW